MCKNDFVGRELQKNNYLCTTFRKSKPLGEMAEWSIAAVLKTVELRGSGGSNPSLSAGRLRQKRSKARQVLQIIDLWDFFHVARVPLKVTDKPKKDIIP